MNIVETQEKLLKIGKNKAVKTLQDFKEFSKILSFGEGKEKENLIEQAKEYVIEKVLKNEFFLSRNEICNIHYIVSLNDKRIAGKFRERNITIERTKWTGYKVYQLSNVFMDLSRDYKYNKNVGIRELELCLDIAKSQFFDYDNKKTAILVANALLVNQGFAPFVIDFRSKENPYLLVNFYDEEKINHDKLKENVNAKVTHTAKKILLAKLITEQQKMTRNILSADMLDILKKYNKTKIR